ncbi:hypothetical protein [Flavobacterium sp. MDT1-60]|uniref:hypothetical protein n=1 Tax=Flavobacterium sp. MDT1-60 TaxID=1979344 RepID=UPI00177B5D03|nr:hypothetical protein [Flavobacterium sp. MDT1-60]QOG02385.1 hypothetical protein IHE43_21815 [Flavobacterium sp. MDT1-60]
MRKITCLLLLIQFGFINAQTKTVVTQNGEKLAISPYANNGLSANNGFIQLGGSLITPSVLATSSTNTLAFTGLQSGSTADNVLVTDANGVLKYVSRSSFGGADNLGNHIATMDLNMSTKSILNIQNAYIKNEAQISDRVTTNTNYFGIYKNNGFFGIWNNLKSTNALTIDESTNKTTLTSAQIAKGTDGLAPLAGYVAMANDNNGNVVWRPLAEVSGTSSIQFFQQSTGKSTEGSTTWNNVPGFANMTYKAPADGDMVVTIILYSALNQNPSAGTPAMTNTQMQFTVNGTAVAYGMSTPIGVSGAGFNPECTTVIAKFSVIKGTTYTFNVQARDVWKSNTAGAYVGTFTWTSYSSPSTIMGMLITK